MHLTKILCQHLNNRWGWMQKSSPETIMEAFKIVDGEILTIEAVFDYVPYGMHSPWAEGEE